MVTIFTLRGYILKNITDKTAREVWSYENHNEGLGTKNCASPFSMHQTKHSRRIMKY